MADATEDNVIDRWFSEFSGSRSIDYYSCALQGLIGSVAFCLSEVLLKAFCVLCLSLCIIIIIGLGLFRKGASPLENYFSFA